jgi:RES domain-containing protein
MEFPCKDLSAVPSSCGILSLKREALRGSLSMGWAVKFTARFTPTNSFETVYLGEDMVTALREVEAVIAGSVGLKLTIPAPPWVLVVVKGALSSVLDLTVPANMQKLGATYQELTGAWRYVRGQAGETPTHVLGRLCYSSKRFDAIRFPSSKNPPDGVCLAVFPDRLKGASYLEVHDPYRNVPQRIPSLLLRANGN